jgi:hypothetical protein
MFCQKALCISCLFFSLMFYPKDIFSETSAGSESLSGEYYFGDGLGVNNVLNLSRDGTFSFKWGGVFRTL